MECRDRSLLEYKNTLDKFLSKYSLSEILSYVKKWFGSNPEVDTNITEILHPLIEYLNRKDFTECVLRMQTITTTPNWYELFEPFLITNPIDKDKIIEKYRLIGLTENFLRILIFSSGRPKINMLPYLEYFNIKPKYYRDNFQSSRVISHYIEPYFVSNEKNGILENVLIPVIRYQQGMSGYLTSGDSELSYGTFYYYEPESPCFLHSIKTLVSWNKITACLDFGIDIEIVQQMLYEKVKDRIMINEFDEAIDLYPKDMGLNTYGTKREQWNQVVEFYRDRNLNPLIHLPDMYAVEDIFDELLHKTAIEKKIDMILLKYMTGETRVVTEIYDVRDRKISFENLLFPPINT